MKTRKLELTCPHCGSGEIFYSCSPGCCYNHVCNGCGATFEPATAAAGGYVTGVIPPDPLPESTDPTTECARCQSNAVYVMEDGGLVCGDCGAKLVLEMG